MGGIEASADAESVKSAQDGSDFFEARADRGAHAGGVFNQDTKVAQLNAADGFFHTVDDGGDCGFHFRIAARAGMNDEVIRADRKSANDFIMKGLNRTGAQHRLGCRKIDQIIRMDDQRTEAQFFAARPKGGRSGVWNAGWTAGPHARAGGKNLQRVATELASRFQRFNVAFADGGVDADAQTSIDPGGRGGLRRRLGAVFVLGIELLVVKVEWVNPQIFYFWFRLGRDSLRLRHSSARHSLWSVNSLFYPT